MKYHKLTRIIVVIFYLYFIISCATKITYNPTVNPDVVSAMQTIREKILTQPGLKTPYYADVTETLLTVKGPFEGDRIESNEPTGIFEFKSITEMVFNHKRDWFMVTLVSNGSSLYRYFTHSEEDAQKFMDSIYTMMKHNPDSSKPIKLIAKPILNKTGNFSREDLNYAD
jgi:hypothetical protein